MEKTIKRGNILINILFVILFIIIIIFGIILYNQNTKISNLSDQLHSHSTKVLKVYFEERVISSTGGETEEICLKACKEKNHEGLDKAEKIDINTYICTCYKLVYES